MRLHSILLLLHFSSICLILILQSLIVIELLLLPQLLPLYKLLMKRLRLHHALANLFAILVQLVLDDGIIDRVLVGVVNESAITSKIATLLFLARAVNKLLNGRDELLAVLEKVGGFECS